MTPLNVRFAADQRTKLIDFGALASFGRVSGAPTQSMDDDDDMDVSATVID